MFNQSGLTRSNLAAMLIVSADVSARDDAYDDVGHMNYDEIDIAGLESIPSEIIRAMMHAEAFRIFPEA